MGRVRQDAMWWLISDESPLHLTWSCVQKMDLQEYRDALAWALDRHERRKAQAPKGR